jgi:hypothetical protein
MKKFNWMEFITSLAIIAFLGYVLYFGFRFLYYAWFN